MKLININGNWYDLEKLSYKDYKSLTGNNYQSYLKLLKKNGVKLNKGK